MLRSLGRFCLTSLLLTPIFCCNTARAELLYGVLDGYVLVTIDTDTRAGNVVGTLGGFYDVGGLTFDNNGILYGVSSEGRLLTINTTNGHGTLVGNIPDLLSYSTGLANDPTTDMLYGITAEGASVSSYLVKYSKANAAVTPIGDTSAIAIVGLSFDATGQLWGIDGRPGNEELIKINKNTGDSAVIGTGGLSDLPYIGSLAIGNDGTFYAIHNGDDDLELVTIDPATGTPTVQGVITGLDIVTTYQDIVGLAAAPIPEPTAASLLLLGSVACLRRNTRRA